MIKPRMNHPDQLEKIYIKKPKLMGLMKNK